MTANVYAHSDGESVVLGAGGAEGIVYNAQGLKYPRIVQNINVQTGTTYSLVLSDVNKLITLSNASPVTLTIPTNSVVAFPIGTTVDAVQYGVGQLTISGAGVTIRNTPGNKARAQYSGVTMIKIATDEWLLVGDLTA
jgi:hypothetical protein